MNSPPVSIPEFSEATPTMRHQRGPRRRPSAVAVLDDQGRFLAPCKPARARQLISCGRAWLLSAEPPRIQLTYKPQQEAPDQP
ncbi:hypothetical protein Thi970DRAFT_00431 [Thiorhodovibrio frisius]|uniref:RRXRR domain-containing protein n=2 Tax=Thiorhodovibrio frisius TaxID=631362 RepID=H8YWH0_9GAMM|nr:RRXRR domain-containing protein [Thiorhodovibrio frisius]EIC22796.1 hypothetical protein Thi970DRAFT_00431 [Thiorhodovibrio frisius]WPL23085.1 hypothetical protein Thiofri_03267 [Thiorhodovibrio frisius]